MTNPKEIIERLADKKCPMSTCINNPFKRCQKCFGKPYTDINKPILIGDVMQKMLEFRINGDWTKWHEEELIQIKLPTLIRFWGNTSKSLQEIAGDVEERCEKCTFIREFHEPEGACGDGNAEYKKKLKPEAQYLFNFIDNLKV